MSRAGWKQRFSYWFDNQLAKGPWTLIGWLGLATILVVFLATILALIFHAQPLGSGFKEVFWDFLFQALTPNPFDVSAPGLFLVIILLITILSLLMVSILIGILTTGIENRLQSLRRGRSKVLEKNHTLILGWSHQVFTILKELITAYENHKEAFIVILADEDKVKMDTAIRERIPDTKNTRIICRSGTPMDLDDLEIGSPHTARSIIILPPEGDNPDSYVIKTILAIINHPHRRKEPYHIATQILSEHNFDVVNMVGGNDEIHAILLGDQIARMVAQTSRQSGLSVVYTELLNFSGDEIYFTPEPGLVGKTYGEALMAYDDSSLMGLRLSDGKIVLNPPADTKISAGDEVIAISQDYNTVKLSNLKSIPLMPDLIRPNHSAQFLKPEKGLILGWNSKAPVIIQELENYVAPGSELQVISAVEIDQELKTECMKCTNQRVTFTTGDVSDRQVLNRFDITSYQHIIVLAYDGLDEQSADAETMVTLLHLRHIAEAKGCRVPIVSEMLDLRNRRLAEVARVDDFIVSDHLISLMLAQLSQNNELYHVFTELFDSVGPELYFKPITDYIQAGKPVSYYTLVEAARRRGETAIGYRLMSEVNVEPNYGIYMNPKKSTILSLCEQDRILVLADRQ